MTAGIPRQAVVRHYRVLVGESNTADWHAGRKQLIGASEAAAILGDTAWGTPRSIWYAKRSDVVEDIGTDLMEFGHLAEPLIQAFMEAHPERYAFIGQIVDSEGLLQSLEWPWLGGTLDRRVRTPLGFYVPLEMKSVGDHAAREWWVGGETDEEDAFGSGPGRGSRVVVPKKYQVQVQQQMAVTAAPFAYVAVWLGKERLEVVRVERDEDFIQEHLVVALGDFWQRCVVDGEAPPLSLGDDLWAEYPGTPGEQITADEELLDLIGRFREAKVDEGIIKRDLDGSRGRAATKTRPAEEAVMGLKFQIAEAMGNATEVVHPRSGKIIHTLKGQNTARRIDTDRLEQEYPDVYADVVSEPGYTRVHRGTKEAVDAD